MTAAEIDAAARALYEACDTPKPAWDQLGDATKSVWRGYVELDNDRNPHEPQPGDIL